jgi:regulatory protein
VAEEATASVSDEDERDRARALVDKKLRAMHGLGIEVQTRRLAAMLARKGYMSSLTYAVIREAIADAPEHLPD